VNEAELNKKFEQAKANKTRLEPNWYLNMAYYVGDQWMYWNRGRLERPKLDPWRFLAVDNRIQPVVRNEIAKMTKQQPIFQVTPQTADDEDVNSARLCEQLLDYEWNHLDLRAKLLDALHWSRICGSGFWKVFWDKSIGLGTSYLVGPDGKPALDDNGRPLRAEGLDPKTLQDLMMNGVKPQMINEGDVGVEVRSPFELFPDPLAHNLGEAEYLFEETVKSPDYVYKRYGITVPPDSAPTLGIVESRMWTQFDAVKTGVKVREFWCRPNKEYPNGCRTVMINNKVVDHDDNPSDPMPYVMFKNIDVPGRFWPDSVVSQLRGPQTELNKIKSQILENAARIGNPALMTSRQAGVEYSGRPGERIFYDSTVADAVPRYLQPAEVPGYVREQIDRIESSIREISGQHEITSGKVPAGVTAASAINLLLEQDDTRLGPAIYDMEANLANAGAKIAKLIAKFYSTERTVALVDDEGAWDVFGFRGNMLKDNTQVNVQAGSAFPRSKAAKQAAMQDILHLFIQNGVAFDSRNLGKYLRDLDVGGLEKLIDQFSVDESQINWENGQMAMGKPVPINQFDNDQSHVQGHEDFQKSSKYRQLDPQMQMLFQQHVDEHKAHIQQAQDQQMQQQAQQQAMMAQASQPSQPPQGPAQSGPPQQ
jgi:hypothetical protein